MDARSIIETLKAGCTPEPDAIDWFVRGLANGAVSDAQAAAFAMAVRLKGLTNQGRVNLTLAMRDSGDCLTWDLPGPVLDKHSTGGIGDAVSLVLAPALAACGAFVPMISGRGLGHTGGTLDKLEAIPGLRTDQSPESFRSIVTDVGCAIVSASARLAPADARLYAIRDVTATVDSIDLITSSILSKKLAAGLQGLVLDVKFGSGATLTDIKDARVLAQTMVDCANGAGCATSAILSDMNQPVLNSVGNALELRGVMECLSGAKTQPRLSQLVETLGGILLEQAGLAQTGQGAMAIRAAIDGGSALSRFGRMVAAMGGPVDFATNWDSHLATSSTVKAMTAPRSGYLTTINGIELGMTSVALGGGRRNMADKINPSVGLSEILPLGSLLKKGDHILRIHAATEADANEAARRIMAAITISDHPIDPLPLVIERIT